MIRSQVKVTTAESLMRWCWRWWWRRWWWWQNTCISLSILTYRFTNNFRNCFSQSFTVCGETRIDIDFNQPYLQKVAFTDN